MRSKADNNEVISNAVGNPIRFLTDPLAEKYITPPGDWVSEGMLPHQEFEVRHALVEMKVATEQIASIGFFERLLKSSSYRQAYEMAQDKQRTLMLLVNSSPEHKAAIRRIVSEMPSGNGGREALAAYTASR